jgi:hypothetical protein
LPSPKASQRGGTRLPLVECARYRDTPYARGTLNSGNLQYKAHRAPGTLGWARLGCLRLGGRSCLRGHSGRGGGGLRLECRGRFGCRACWFIFCLHGFRWLRMHWKRYGRQVFCPGGSAIPPNSCRRPRSPSFIEAGRADGPARKPGGRLEFNRPARSSG